MKRHINVINRVRKHFPQVDRVVDATESIAVKVQKRDSKQGRKKSPSQCALARACVREEHADGAIINIGYSYIIKGDTATRYKTSIGVGREITSFDRHQDFAAGTDYVLSKVSPGNRLGAQYKKKRRGPHLTTKPDTSVIHRHRTTKIRVSKAD